MAGAIATRDLPQLLTELAQSPVVESGDRPGVEGGAKPYVAKYVPDAGTIGMLEGADGGGQRPEAIRVSGKTILRKLQEELHKIVGRDFKHDPTGLWAMVNGVSQVLSRLETMVFESMTKTGKRLGDKDLEPLHQELEQSVKVELKQWKPDANATQIDWMVAAAKDVLRQLALKANDF